ncbi:hypothetical protein ACJMK2_020841 [Sinanodonta woodiana]|uniref:Uncharacterized protein n=1 Tax=Sinanodonta woodiana TaxID=1069815 RepID=A0ABD3U1R6_SINWO
MKISKLVDNLQCFSEVAELHPGTILFFNIMIFTLKIITSWCVLGENCFYYGKSSTSMTYNMYCSYGCCGDYYNQYCCQPGYGQPYVIKNAGYHSEKTQYTAGIAVYVQGDTKARYLTGHATYQAAQAPPPYLE